jgi:hypothetical protein
MKVLEDFGSLGADLASGRISESQVHQAFDETVREVSPATLANGLSEAFRSDRTPPFEQMLTGLYRRSNPAQKAGLINQILAGLGAVGAAQVLPSGWIRALPGVLRGARVTPEQATQVTAEEVEVLARKAASRDPRILERAADFYAQHPALVKAIGAGALALVMSRIPRRDGERTNPLPG